VVLYRQTKGVVIVADAKAQLREIVADLNRRGKSQHKETYVESRYCGGLEFKASAANVFNAAPSLVPTRFPGPITTVTEFSHRYAELVVKEVPHSKGIKMP
jgi:hypothetical protein